MKEISAMNTWLSVSALILLGLCQLSRTSPLFCYFTNWSQYRLNEGRYTADDVPADLCTHVIFAFAILSNDQIISAEWNDEDFVGDVSSGNYAKVMAAKDANPDLKVLLAIGGWTAGITEFTNTVSTAEHRAAFIQNAITYLELWGFDGLELDWEYPAQRGSPAGDRELFTLWVKEIQEGFTDRSLSTGMDILLLTAAVKIGDTSTTSYEIDQIGSYLDYVSLMAYDIYGSFNTAQGAYSHTPMPFIEAVVTQWINAGFPKERLVLGVATYGRSFTLTNSANTTPRSSFWAAGQAGAYTLTAGFLAYYEICSHILNDGWTEVYHEESKTPYAYKGDQWVGFDNAQSVLDKVALIKSQGLAGAMVWALPLDDFNNICGDGAYPLITAVKGALDSDTDIPTTTSTADTEGTTSTVETTTSFNGADETTTRFTAAEETTTAFNDVDETTTTYTGPDETTTSPNGADETTTTYTEAEENTTFSNAAEETTTSFNDADETTTTYTVAGETTTADNGAEETTTYNSHEGDGTTTIETDTDRPHDRWEGGWVGGRSGGHEGGRSGGRMGGWNGRY